MTRIDTRGVGCVPEISRAIPLRVFQLFKSERWNSAVFEVVLCVAVGELHAELVGSAAPTLLRARLLRASSCVL